MILPRQATSGPLQGSTARQRPVGRVRGIMGRDAGDSALSNALGPGAQVLVAGGTDLVVDWDSCWLDGTPVENLDHWRALLAAGRLPDVEGAFACGWRTAADTLTLARDAPGERTLFYVPLAHGLVFASSLRAILATGLVPGCLHLPSIATYLSYAYLPGRETLVAGVYELLPGEMVVWQPGILTRRGFWSLPSGDPQPRCEEAWRVELRRCLEEAVRRRLPRGETIGASLSGGIDSSLVVALARQLHDAPIKTFSISFGAGYANELPFSKLVAEYCQTEHCILELSSTAILRHLDDTIALLSDPNGDPLTVPNALLFRAAASDVGVVLNGEGGDPCFGGPKNLPMLLAELYDQGDGVRERSYLVGTRYVSSRANNYSPTQDARKFENYAKGKLAGQVSVVQNSRQDRLIRQMERGPVIVIHFPNSLQGFWLGASREQMATLPEGFILSGLDTAIAMVMYPDILARDRYTPHLMLAALSWQSARYSPQFQTVPVESGFIIIDYRSPSFEWSVYSAGLCVMEP